MLCCLGCTRHCFKHWVDFTAVLTERCRCETSTTDVFTSLLTLQVWVWMKQAHAGHSYHLNYLFILPLWPMACRHYCQLQLRFGAVWSGRNDPALGAKILVSVCVIERWFHFPPHLSSATTLPWEITEHKKWPISPFLLGHSVDVL